MFGERLRIMLVKRDMTQKDLAMKVGITETTVSRYVSSEREPRISVIKKIAEVLDCSVEYLFYGSEGKEMKVTRKVMKEVEETDAYDRGYAQGIIQGRVDARTMKENADGCIGCAFIDVNSWEMPCAKCKRNAYDYWRSK